MVAYPNPTQNVLNTKSQNSVVQAQVFELNGQLLLNAKVTNDILDMSSLQQDNYIVQLFHENGAVSTTNIVKE